MTFNIVLAKISQQLNNKELVEQAIAQAKLDFQLKSSMRVRASVRPQKKQILHLMKSAAKLILLHVWKFIQRVLTTVEGSLVTAASTYVILKFGLDVCK